MPNQYSYSVDFATQRREYNKLRAIASKRVKRLQAAGLDIIAGYYNPYDIRKLADIKTEAELKFSLAAVKKFLNRPTTVKAARLQYNNLMEILNRRYAPDYDPETGEGALFKDYSQVNEQSRYFEYLRLRYGRTFVSASSGDLYDHFLDNINAGVGDGIDIARTVKDFFDVEKAEAETKKQRELLYSMGRKRAQKF